MTISLTIPDAVAPRVVEALCAEYGYNAHVDEFTLAGKTPLTKGQFAKQCVIDFAKSAVIRYEAKIAVAAAENSSVAKTSSEISIS